MLDKTTPAFCSVDYCYVFEYGYLNYSMVQIERKELSICRAKCHDYLIGNAIAKVVRNG